MYACSATLLTRFSPKFYLPALLMLLLHRVVGQDTPGQSYKLPCDCQILKSGRSGYLPSEQEAGKLVAQYLDLVRRNSTLTYNTPIAIREGGCGAPESRNCPTQLPNGQSADVPLILYNNFFLNQLTRKEGPVTLIDRHIIAHEIGHHVFGHLKNTADEAVFSTMYGTDAGSTFRIARRYKVSNQQAEEIQADFFGLWLLSLTEKKFDFEAFIADFDTDYIRKYIESDTTYTATHPLFRDRIGAMRRFWDQLQRFNYQKNGIGRGYFASSASAAYVDLHPERAFYDLALVAGLTVVGQPVFSVGSNRVDALLYPISDAPNLYLGLSVSRFNWQSSLRFEGELAWSRQRYGTLIGGGSGQQLLETLDLRYLTVVPKLTWSPGGRRRSGRFSTSRVGVFASAGPSLRIPLSLTYQNNAVPVDPPNRPGLQWSVSPRLSAGVEWLTKTFRPRGYKLALTYERQAIRLAANPRPSALSHNLDVTLYYTFVRF